MIRQEITRLIQKATGESQEKIRVTCPEGDGFGDYTTNIALQLKKPADEIAGKLKSALFEKVEVKGPGFINFFLSKEYLRKQAGAILKEKESFGKLKIGRGQKVNVEFISANPTGPLTLGNGRGGFWGDVLANVLSAAGFEAKREYYINDTGEQIRKLGHSVIGDSEAVYQGQYIEELRKKIKGNDPEKIGLAAAKIILREMIKPTIKKMKIKFDVWFSEKTLYQKKEADKILDILKKKRLSYESEGALWFKSTQFGDDKDRVLIKAGGEETYLTSDIAYLKNKLARGFQKLIFFWGADHYGYVARLKAAAEALGYKKEQINIIVMQLVRLIREGKEVRMSKRTGTYVTLDELIDEVGLDVARFFFLTRSADTHLNFDLALAKTQSDKNPVYYIQYAHARICSILRKAKMLKVGPSTSLLEHPTEMKLIRQLMRFPEVIEDTAKDYQVQRLPQYAVDLAAVFHQFYRDCHVISEDKNLTQARLSLVSATQIVLKNALSLMGVSAPEKM
ncbi:MAG: arginine--tRNA ligase [Candidatus Nealsonbacteria bacterium]